MISKVFRLEKGRSIAGIARAMDAFLRQEEGMSVTRYRSEDGSYFICARAAEGRVLRWAGLDCGISISVLASSAQSATVTICANRWRDKGMALCISLFMLWPLAFTACFGCIRQSCLPTQLFAVVNRYLKNEPQTGRFSAGTATEVRPC